MNCIEYNLKRKEHMLPRSINLLNLIRSKLEKIDLVVKMIVVVAKETLG